MNVSLVNLELDFNSTGVLVVLHTSLSIFGKFSVHAWSQCEGLNKKLFILGHLRDKLILACQEVLN